MLNNKKNKKKTIETSLEANLMKEPMSALFFLTLIEVDYWFFWPELKLKRFFLFSNKLIWFFFVACVPWILFFFVFLIKKNKFWGTEIDYNWFVSPIICFFLIRNTKKNKIQGTQPQKKSNKLIWK